MNIAKNTVCLGTMTMPKVQHDFMQKPFQTPQLARSILHPGDYPSGKEGDVITVEFTVMGVACIGLNGGPDFQHNEFHFRWRLKPRRNRPLLECHYWQWWSGK